MATPAKSGRWSVSYTHLDVYKRQPVHGSAPDIAGKGMANPIAMLASFGMALRYSFNMGKEADRLDAAIAAALGKGLRTADRCV